MDELNFTEHVAQLKRNFIDPLAEQCHFFDETGKLLGETPPPSKLEWQNVHGHMDTLSQRILNLEQSGVNLPPVVFPPTLPGGEPPINPLELSLLARIAVLEGREDSVPKYWLDTNAKFQELERAHLVCMREMGPLQQMV